MRVPPGLPENTSLMTLAPGKKIVWGAGLIAVLATLFVLISPYISLEYLESQRSAYLQYYQSNSLVVLLLFIATASLIIGAAFPATGAFALLSGALFGLTVGLVAMSIATTIGSTIVFLWSRYLFRDWLQNRFQKQFSVINDGIAEEGGYYLFSLRLLMIFPSFLINIICGLTNMKMSIYLIVTFFSQTIVIAVWIYAGATLASFDTLGEIFTFKTFFVFTLVGLAPLICHRILLWARGRKSYQIAKNQKDFVL